MNHSVLDNLHNTFLMLSVLILLRWVLSALYDQNTYAPFIKHCGVSHSLFIYLCDFQAHQTGYDAHFFKNNSRGFH